MVQPAEKWGHNQNQWSEEHRVSTTPPETGEGAGCLRLSILGAITVGTVLFAVSQGCESDKSSPELPRVEYDQTVVDTIPLHEEQHITTHTAETDTVDTYAIAELPLSALVDFAPETVTG